MRKHTVSRVTSALSRLSLLVLFACSGELSTSSGKASAELGGECGGSEYGGGEYGGGEYGGGEYGGGEYGGSSYGGHCGGAEPFTCASIFGSPTTIPTPAGTTIHAGDPWLASWLHNYKVNSKDPCDWCEVSCWLFDTCVISSTTRSAIARDCNSGTIVEKIRCVMSRVQAELGSNPDAVCRHHAICVERIFEEMGIDADLEMGMLVCWPPEGHAWVEFDYAGREYVVDSYNDICYSYPD